MEVNGRNKSIVLGVLHPVETIGVSSENLEIAIFLKSRGVLPEYPYISHSKMKTESFTHNWQNLRFIMQGSMTGIMAHLTYTIHSSADIVTDDSPIIGKFSPKVERLCTYRCFLQISLLRLGEKW